MDSGASGEEIGELSFRVRAYQRDFLKRFGQNNCFSARPDGVGEDSGEVELSLGLSLGGCFGVDPKEKTKLGRSSSIASVLMLPREGERDGPEHDFFAGVPLTRACSLPAENEEELRLRKELQCLKRLEAKRKRSEKRNGRYDSLVEDLKASQSKMRRFVSGDQLNGVTAHQGLHGGAMGSVEWPKSFRSAPASQGSIGSQGSGSSGLSDSGVQPSVLGFETPRLGSSSEDQSPSTSHSLPDNGNNKKHTVSREKGDLSARKTPCIVNGRGVSRDAERSIMEEMPFVSTKGDGPNGRRIEGFLYKYRKGEEVRIVCVCHGSFLTPAEFVKHAGGGDVAHPLRHIVVNPFPSSLF